MTYYRIIDKGPGGYMEISIDQIKLEKSFILKLTNQN